MSTLELAGLLISAAMVCLIWQIQLVQYPGFIFMRADRFKAAMKHHQDRISLIVLPLMLGELMISIMGVVQGSALSVPILTLVVLCWLSTFFIQVPIHQRLLNEGYEEGLIQKLVSSNWIRTGLWTIKLALVIFTQIR